MDDKPETRIQGQDISLFRHVLSQSTDDDKRSLLALQAGLREQVKEFVYLEIGSYKGGSLQPYVVDPRCARIISIDPRPNTLPDARGSERYSENTTTGMLQLLSAIP